MYRIQKRFSVPIGHRLSFHKGKCANFHGHNFDFVIGLKRPDLNVHGMVMDFSDLKEFVVAIIGKWDHALLLYNKDYKKLCKQMDIESVFGRVFNIHSLSFEPTAENLARNVFEQLKYQINKLYPDVMLEFVEVWENSNSMAEYRED